MSSYMNFGDVSHPDGIGSKPVVNSPLARQSSLYSLTFDELQNTLLGKDFGSMNMDELLKNIWTAEETQAMASSTGVGEGSVPCGNLQKQGSLTLPRTLSQKTVDEVWRDFLKGSEGLKGGIDNGVSNLPQRQPTLGEMTLEDFLLRVGVVGEATQPIGRPDNGGFYGEISQPNSNDSDFTFGFQQLAPNHGSMANQITENNNAVPNLSSNLPLNALGIRSSQQQQQQPLPQPLFPKQVTVAFASPMQLANNAQLVSPGTRAPIKGRADPSMNSTLVQGGVDRVVQNGALGVAAVGTGVTIVAAGSPIKQFPSNVIPKNNLDTSSLSSSAYAFSEGVRGRKCGGTLEKVVERRRRRMIKNRESASRSRARKQAYTLELEAEITKLKEMNQHLQKKQAEFMEMPTNQTVEKKMKLPWGGKTLCLRRTRTGPW